MAALVVAMLAKTFFEESGGKNAGLGQSIHAFVDADVDVAVVDLVKELVLLYDFFRDQIETDFHIFGFLHGSGEIEIFNISHNHSGARG